MKQCNQKEKMKAIKFNGSPKIDTNLVTYIFTPQAYANMWFEHKEIC